MSLEAAIARIATLHGVELTVGLQGEAASGRHTGTELVEIASRHEFGHGVPMRPFLRTSLKLKGKRWVNGMRQLVREYRKGNRSAAALTFRHVALVAVGDVQATIRDHDWTPNSPYTIAQKARNGRLPVQPLIDSGQMRASIRAGAVIPGRATEVIG